MEEVIEDMSPEELNSKELIELEFPVSGVTFEGRQKFLEEMSKQDKRLIDIDLIADNENVFDTNAVKVVASYDNYGEGALYHHIGYVPKNGARVTRQCLESKRPYSVEIIWIGQGLTPEKALGSYGIKIKAKFFPPQAK